MNKKIIDKINSEIKRKKISSKEIKRVKLDAKKHIDDLQRKSSINLNQGAESTISYLIARLSLERYRKIM